MLQYYLKGMEDKMDKVLITGATGFIGSHVAEVFCQNGVETGCLVRPGSSIENLNGILVTIEYGDIEDLDGLINICKEYTFVIHIAAYARDWGGYGKFYRVNVYGTLNVLKACYKSGINNVIITSSCSVYGEENCSEIKDENSPCNSHYPYFLDKLFPSAMNYYRDSKALAKVKAMEYAKKMKLNLTIIEPVWVFGEREFNTGFYEYLKSAQSKIPFLPGSRKNKFHVIYSKDLAMAYFKAFEKRLDGINSFIIGNEQAPLMDYFYTVLCSEAGIKKPQRLPKAPLYPLAFILELVHTVLRIKTPPLLTRGRLNMFYDNIEYSTSKAKEQLGFEAEYSIEDGIERTVNWYRKHKLIDT